MTAQKQVGSNGTMSDQNDQANANLPQVLIVDDTVFNLQILSMIFQTQFKIKVDQAVDGEEAVMKCQKRIENKEPAYRLIVMDINMPGIDGVVTTAKIRESTDDYVKKIGQRDYVIIAHTALPGDQFGDPKEKGFDGFLPKNDNEKLKKFVKIANVQPT